MKRNPDSWRQKVHPLFIEGEEVHRHAVKRFLALGPNPSAEKTTEVDASFHQELEKVRARYANGYYTPTAPDPLDIIFVNFGPAAWPPTQREMDQSFLEQLYWNRFREPLWIAVLKVETGDIKALRRIHRVSEDYERLRLGKGPIKAAKGNLDHAGLIIMGFDMGLNTLTSEELADCFDALCPCGTIHDADSLKKQRSRYMRAVQKGWDWLAAKRAKMSTAEWMYAYGADGLFAKGVPSVGGKPRRVYIGQIGGQILCYITSDGGVVTYDGSPFNRPDAPEVLARAFVVNTTADLFKMFFPS